jgi:cell division protein FtsB
MNYPTTSNTTLHKQVAIRLRAHRQRILDLEREVLALKRENAALRRENERLKQPVHEDECPV